MILRISPIVLWKIHSREVVAIYLLGTVEVDFHFPTIKIHKMAKMPFITDPRYAYDDQKKYEAHVKVREDVSMTYHAAYPQEHEIGLPREKM